MAAACLLNSYLSTCVTIAFFLCQNISVSSLPLIASHCPNNSSLFAVSPCHPLPLPASSSLWPLPGLDLLFSTSKASLSGLQRQRDCHMVNDDYYYVFLPAVVCLSICLSVNKTHTQIVMSVFVVADLSLLSEQKYK